MVAIPLTKLSSLNFLIRARTSSPRPGYFRKEFGYKMIFIRNLETRKNRETVETWNTCLPFRLHRWHPPSNFCIPKTCSRIPPKIENKKQLPIQEWLRWGRKLKPLCPRRPYCLQTYLVQGIVVWVVEVCIVLLFCFRSTESLCEHQTINNFVVFRSVC